MSPFVDLDATWLAFPGDSARYIYRVSPDVIDEFLGSDDASYDRTRCNPDSELQGMSRQCELTCRNLVHRERQLGHRHAMRRRSRGQASGDHVSVANRLDLFQA